MSYPLAVEPHRRAGSTRALVACLLLAGLGCGGEPANGSRPPVVRAGAGGSMAGSSSGGSSGAAGIPGAGASGGGAGTQAPEGGSAGAAFDAGTQPGLDAGGEASNRVQPGGICERLATLQCEGEARCCPNPGRSFDACFTQQDDSCTNELQLDLIAADPVAGFDADMTAEALTRFEEMATACDPDIAMWGASTDGLRRMLQGTVEPGGSCMPPVGIPTVSAYGAALASCRQGATHACLFTGDGPIPFPPTSATCTERGAQGAACFVDTNCIDALYCDNPLGQYSTGMCAARKPVSAPCASGLECESRFCSAGACVERTAQAAFCLQ